MGTGFLARLLCGLGGGGSAARERSSAPINLSRAEQERQQREEQQQEEEQGQAQQQPREGRPHSRALAAPLLMEASAIRYYGAVTLAALAALHDAGYVHR